MVDAHTNMQPWMFRFLFSLVSVTARTQNKLPPPHSSPSPYLSSCTSVMPQSSSLYLPLPPDHSSLCLPLLIFRSSPLFLPSLLLLHSSPPFIPQQYLPPLLQLHDGSPPPLILPHSSSSTVLLASLVSSLLCILNKKWACSTTMYFLWQKQAYSLSECWCIHSHTLQWSHMYTWLAY